MLILFVQILSQSTFTKIMKNFSATKYSLQNVTTGRIFEDEGWLLDDPEGGSPSLIRARYTTRQIEPGGEIGRAHV